MKSDLIKEVKEFAESVWWNYEKILIFFYDKLSDEDLKQFKGFTVKEKVYNYIHENRPELNNL